MILYDLVLILALVLYLPKLFYDRFKLGKYKGYIPNRLGLVLPDFTNNPIWIHAVSVGETKAIKPLVDQIHSTYPDREIVISTTTVTGLLQAKELYPFAQTHFLLPLDFSFTMRRLIKKMNPSLLILSEGDLWYHLLTYCKKNGTKTILVNGKISPRSTRRFSKVPFTKKLFSLLDLVAAQSQEYQERFISLGVDPQKITVTGNMKLDLPKDPITHDVDSFRKRLHLQEDDVVITLGSTHRDEELLLLKELKKIEGIKVLICPRHPERFNQVKEQLDCATYTNPQPSSIILIDQMGLLPLCYQVSILAIVGGSFIRGIGGHNIIEPIHSQCPVIFGPYMESQQNLVDLVLRHNAGIQASIEEVSGHLECFFKDPEPLRTGGKELKKQLHGSTERTWEWIAPLLQLK